MTSEPGVGTSTATPASERLMNHANESAQATTDMSLSEPTGGASQPAQNVSYGGVAAGRSRSRQPAKYALFRRPAMHYLLWPVK